MSKNQKQFDAIKERMAKTSPGPWKIDRYSDDSDFITDIWFNQDGNHVEVHDNSIMQSVINAQFIAHAREDVPALVAEVERLKADRERWFKRESSLQKEIERLQAIEIESDSKLCKQKKEIEQLQKSITWHDHEHSRLHNLLQKRL